MAQLSPEKKVKLKADVLAELEADSRRLSGLKNNISEKPPREKRTVKISSERIGEAVLEVNKPLKENLPNKIKVRLPKINLPKNNLFFAMIKGAIILISIILLVLVVDIVFIYKFSWQDNFSYQVAKIFNLPAGAVNGQNIKLIDYLDNIRVLKVAISNNREGVALNLGGGNNVNEKIFQILTANNLVKEQLRKYNKVVNEQDLDNPLKAIITQLGGKQKAEETISRLYNLNLGEFKEKILRPLMERENLQAAIMKDENLEINKEAKFKAEEVLKIALQPKVDFKVLAKQYTEDEAGINTGGDLGLISKGETAPEFESIVFFLPPRTVYDKLFVNKIGYYIIKVDEKLTDPESGRESVKVSDILIRVDVDKYIKGLMDKAVIKKYVR
ncbi:MAG: peptidylprolyl isomerase [Patescibacteria group bacterium]